MKQFNSKIGLELLPPLLLLFSFLLYQTLIDFNWGGLLITIAVIVFFVYLFLSTKYIIADTTLEVKCGFMTDLFINITGIKRVREVQYIFAAPATSINRLEIKYNEIESVAISPKNKAAFIQELLKINPAIEVVKK